MISSILLDTDVIIDHLRGEEGAEGLFKAIEEGTHLAFFSTITEAEVYSGEMMGRRDVRRRVERLLSLMHRREVTGEIARRAGDLRRRYGIELPNALIAATASDARAKLVTRNIKHYEKIRDVKIQMPGEIVRL